jgi:hypothetical protein
MLEEPQSSREYEAELVLTDDFELPREIKMVDLKKVKCGRRSEFYLDFYLHVEEELKMKIPEVDLHVAELGYKTLECKLKIMPKLNRQVTELSNHLEKLKKDAKKAERMQLVYSSLKFLPVVGYVAYGYVDSGLGVDHEVSTRQEEVKQVEVKYEKACTALETETSRLESMVFDREKSMRYCEMLKKRLCDNQIDIERLQRKGGVGDFCLKYACMSLKAMQYICLRCLEAMQYVCLRCFRVIISMLESYRNEVMFTSVDSIKECNETMAVIKKPKSPKFPKSLSSWNCAGILQDLAKGVLPDNLLTFLFNSLLHLGYPLVLLASLSVQSISPLVCSKLTQSTLWEKLMASKTQPMR